MWGKDKIQFQFTDKQGKAYQFDLVYKKLPSNRSYPTNLDVTVKDATGNKLGYLFWANNGVSFLKQMGQFGMVIKINGQPVDFRFVFDDAKKQGNLRVAQLGNERLVSDTLIPKYGFQMIRPMLLPEAGKGIRSQTFNLDAHPYQMNYSLLDRPGKQVEFQYNLYAKADGRPLMYRVYYYADSLPTLREGMFAGKYFDPKVGPFKLVYYPAEGQTMPPKK